MSSNNQPAPKRRRAEVTREESASRAIPVKSSIWYPDGNFVLQAEGALFKVHRSILAQSSSIFRVLLSVPQPPPINTELVEGCPVLQLSDSAEEVEYVLQAICEREYVGLEESLPLPVISAFVRLGTKYDIYKLRIEGKKRIFDEIPVDLAHAHTAIGPEWKFVTQPEHWFELVVFARNTGLLSILPFALYACCQIYSASEIIHGIKRSDGTILSFAVSDQFACLAGFQAICEAQAETTFSWAYSRTPPAGCTNAGCTHSRDQYLKLYFTSLPSIAGLVPFDKSAFRRSDLCFLCADQAGRMHDAGRKAFWELLPRLFGLPAWEELCKEREEVEWSGHA